MEKDFDEFWQVKPKRKGSNPKDQARIKFIRAVASGIDPQKIVGAARAWAKDECANGKDGSEYVAMAVTWLNQKRYQDYEPINADEIAKWDQTAAKHGYRWVPDPDKPDEGKYVKGEIGGQDKACA